MQRRVLRVYNQVYNSARRFKIYAANSNSYNYKAGRWNTVLYNPDRTCGSSSVFIENQATAGLYTYTPYQPNAAALAAGYGSAPPCGAYGNRNFWLYFTDWFGSTQSPGGTAILARASAPGFDLGPATSSVICGLRDGGCFRNHRNGAVYWSPATGAQIVRGAIGGHWGAVGWEGGRLGYPLREEICGLTDGVCVQEFQGGSGYFSPASGAAAVVGAIRDRWAKQVWEQGPMGYPTGDERCGLSGCFQTFPGGSIYWAPATGARIVSGVVRDAWARQQWERGPLGYPTTDTQCRLADGGCYQAFQGGALVSSTVGETRTLSVAIRDRWLAAGREGGALGYPTGNTVCGLSGNGCFQQFAGGSVYITPATGARVVSGGELTAWAGLQWERGPLGYPTGERTCGQEDSGCYQHFQGGSIYTLSATGTHVVRAVVRAAWAAQGWERGRLGYPTTDTQCGLADGGCSQTFQGGAIYWLPITQARPVVGAIRGAWSATGAEGGPLGYPTRAESCGLVGGGCFQTFQHGSVYWSPATGAHPVSGAILAMWGDTGWERGPLGYPTADPVTTATEITQRFQGGTLVQNRSSGRVTRR